MENGIRGRLPPEQSSLPGDAHVLADRIPLPAPALDPPLDDADDDIEEITEYVVCEFPNLVGQDAASALNMQIFELRNLESARPLARVDNSLYIGSPASYLGTGLIFEELADGPAYIGSTERRVVFQLPSSP